MGGTGGTSSPRWARAGAARARHRIKLRYMDGVSGPASSRQRPALSFGGQPDQSEADEVDGTHGSASPLPTDVELGHHRRQLKDPYGCDDPAEVVPEALAGGPDLGAEQLGQIQGEPAVECCRDGTGHERPAQVGRPVVVVELIESRNRANRTD